MTSNSDEKGLNMFQESQIKSMISQTDNYITNKSNVKPHRC